MTWLYTAISLLAAAIAWKTGISLPSKPPRPLDPSLERIRLMDNTRYDEIFKKYSRLYFGPAFDWQVFKAQAMAESNLSESARSWVGARGLMQLMPATYSEIQSRNPDFGKINDPRWNIAAGIYYDKKLYDSWNEIVQIRPRMGYTLASYNAGRATIENAKDTMRREGIDHQLWRNVESIAHKVPRWRHMETILYVQKIAMFYDMLRVRNAAQGSLPPPS